MKTVDTVTVIVLIISALAAIWRMSTPQRVRSPWMTEIVGHSSDGHAVYGLKLWLFIALAMFVAVLAMSIFFSSVAPDKYETLLKAESAQALYLGKWCLFSVGGFLFKGPNVRSIRTLCGAVSGFGLGLVVLGALFNFDLIAIL